MAIKFPDDLEWTIEADSIVTIKQVGSGRAKIYGREITNAVQHHYRLTTCLALNATITTEPTGSGLYVIRCTPDPAQRVDELVRDFQVVFPKNRFIQQNQGITNLLVQLGSEDDAFLPANLVWQERDDNSIISTATFSRGDARAYANLIEEEINASGNHLFSAAMVRTQSDDGNNFHLICTPHMAHNQVDFINTFESTFPGYQVDLRGMRLVVGQPAAADQAAEQEPASVADAKWFTSVTGNAAVSDSYTRATAEHLKNSFKSKTGAGKAIVVTVVSDPAPGATGKFCVRVMPKIAVQELSGTVSSQVKSTGKH